ncbi:hypothetical protein NPS74_21780, partial [Cutibacterium acnes subsp. acnes]|nr:hypothetical protein [Cutibacterium acnes subsp. acnes]
MRNAVSRFMLGGWLFIGRSSLGYGHPRRLSVVVIVVFIQHARDALVDLHPIALLQRAVEFDELAVDPDLLLAQVDVRAV